MANQPIPNDPYRPNDPNRPSDAYRTNVSDDDIGRQARLNSELQADPDLADGRSNGGKIAMFAVAIALVLGALFYGFNNTTVNQAGTTPANRTAQTTPPVAPSGMRDVTPKVNNESGTTTGAAPARPANPDMNNSASPPADRAPAAK